MPTREERIAGGLIGLLVGDALGVPYEFNPPGALPPLAEIEFEPPRGFQRSHSGTPPGTWSDDGAQALALLDSLLTRGLLDLDDLSARLVAWREKGAYAVDARLFDIGNQTRQALGALRRGTPAERAGPSEASANGNGSLMRVLPLALWHRGSDAELVADARRQSLVTHGHLRSQLCCALYCLWARAILDEKAEPWREAVAMLRSLYPPGSAERTELDDVIRPDEPPHGSGSGYVLDSLHSARLAMEAGDYEAVVRAAVALGNDTDTTACVAGGPAGLRDGLDAIPARWRDALRGSDILDPLLARLLANA